MQALKTVVSLTCTALILLSLTACKQKSLPFFGRLSVLSFLSIQHYAPSLLKNVFVHFVCFLIIFILLRESNIHSTTNKNLLPDFYTLIFM